MSSQPDNQRPTYRLLIVDDEDVIREGLAGYLENYHEANYNLKLDVCTNPGEARQKLSENKYDLVISDINMPGEDGFAFLQHVQEDYPGTKVALITAYQVEDYIRNAKKTGIFNIIAKTAPFNFNELSSVVNNLLDPESAFGLENYMLEQTQLNEVVIKSSDHIMQTFQELMGFLQKSLPPESQELVNDLLTAVIEAVTNAVYHVAKLPDGSLKYEKGQVIEQLDESEYVYFYYAADADKIGIAIVDQGGRMTADEVVFWLERNISGSNLFDTHGRGVYLMHRLADRVLVNIASGRRTEIIMLTYFSSDFRNNKPVYVNQV